MANFKFAPQCCCELCQRTFVDKFTRDDSTDIGSDWTEVSGDWSIDTNKLSTTAAGVVVANVNDDSKYAVLCFVDMPTDGDEVRVIVGRANANNYCYAQVKRTATNKARLKTFQVSGGTHTQLDDYALDVGWNAGNTTPTLLVKVCWIGSQKRIAAELHSTSDGTYNEDDVYIGGGGGTLISYCDFVAATGTYGIGHGVEAVTVGSEIRVLSYSLYSTLRKELGGGLFEFEDCPMCTSGCERCEDHGWLPNSFTLTVGAGGTCLAAGNYVLPVTASTPTCTYTYNFGFGTTLSMTLNASGSQFRVNVVYTSSSPFCPAYTWATALQDALLPCRSYSSTNIPATSGGSTPTMHLTSNT